MPSCPDWNLGQLLRISAAGHRWVEAVVRTRATQPLPDEGVRAVSGYNDEDPAVLANWLAEGAVQLAGTLRAAGPDAQVDPVPGETSVFLARRFTHERLSTAQTRSWPLVQSSPSTRKSFSTPSTSGWSWTRYRSISRFIPKSVNCSVPAAHSTAWSAG